MNYKKNLLIIISIITAIFTLVACAQTTNNESTNESKTSVIQNDVSMETSSDSTSTTSTKLFNKTDLFTSRDLEQVADLKGAIKYDVLDDTDIDITKEGVYILSGTAKNVTINVNAGDEDKVQLVLNNLNISNEDKECIHVENSDKIFVTTASQSSLNYSVTDLENATGAIFSKDDIVFNGKGTLTINSDNNGIVGKDDIKITGGTYNITASKNSIRANDSIRVAGGTLNLKAGSDGLHAENSDDDTKGYVYIDSCNLNIEAVDDAIHSVYGVQIDGGVISITASEGIEGTYNQINGGEIVINAKDDGVNSARKSSAHTPTFEMNGGSLKINMSQGDTDGIDSNGDIIINGGTIEVTGSSTFDYDGKAEKNGGTIIINGTETDMIPSQMMGTGTRGGKNRFERVF